ncbi:hypothetical protein ceV_275 [Chrysochromulina ericina virus CeV-01B]|uniref:Uncharacterized protein n=1 Tax=Chrysochromulina ericina virus CeV-01B TaxID=3070830 RepID=A0A0N9QJ64_9VIRU|nr:hypothetical protein ceV_275 [Chrysochromulina ericina virus]ALH23181.1 hypothetical protein ceV_275 [Chrysochromulina ericina virus CeV-01B]|tara:strand:- start:79 stop:312 length:234 start_codon:yes stop_codon:yes gene_type:complete
MNISLFILLIIIVINLYISSSNREYYQQVPLKQYEQEKDINIFSNSNSPQDTYQKFNIDLTSSLANVNKAQTMLGMH